MNLKNLFILCLGLMVAGCARSSAPPGPLLPPRPGVRVMNAPNASASQVQARKKTPSAKESEQADIIEEQGIEVLATALKSLPTTRRRRPKGETVYPIELNLQNADLVEAVRALADTLNLNYTIDPKVKGTVNVRASGKLTKSELLSILETMLLVNGAALVKVGKTYNIVPLDKAAGAPAPVFARGVPPVGMTAQVVFLTQTPAKNMTAVLKPLMSAGGKIGEAPNNSLVIVDYPANLEKLANLVNLVDTQGLARTSISIIKVKNTDPNAIIAEMEVIFSAYGALLEKKGRGGMQFLAIPRMNAVMILAASPSLLNRAKFWVRQLDLKTDALANVHVYNVKNYKARNLADLLSQVYGAELAAPGVGEVKPEPTGGLQIRGGRGPGALSTTGREELGFGGARPSGFSSQAGGTGARGVEPGAAPGVTEGLAAAAPRPRERAAPLERAPGVSLEEGVRIIPDEENNLLVVVAPPYEWRIIKSLLEKLDIMPRQVLCEVLIAEVRLDDDLRYGLEWFINNRRIPGGIPPPPGTAPISAGTPASPSLQILRGASAAFSEALGGFTFAARDALNQFRLTINALATKGLVQVLASPHIMAANNQEARIQIGEDVPILTSQSTAVVAAPTVTTNTVDYRSTGIILLVIPQINAKGLITLEIAQEVSFVTSTTTGVDNSPTFVVRQAKTQLITGDNQTVILGGLIREDVERSSAGVPGLKRVPLFGPLFGSETKTKTRTELVVLITPHIVDNLQEGARITREAEDRIDLQGLAPPGYPSKDLPELGATGPGSGPRPAAREKDQ